MIISVDFDGTVVEHAFPAIGKTKLFAFETLKALQDKKHTLILWTYRAGKELQEAVDFCKQNGIEFYAPVRTMDKRAFKNQRPKGKYRRECVEMPEFKGMRSINETVNWVLKGTQITSLRSKKHFMRK